MNKPISGFKRALYGTAAALATAGAAHAATVDAGSASVLDEVVITASRIEREGFSAPTPTTTVSRELIEASAPANLADYVSRLPATAGNFSRQGTSPGTGSSGTFINVRNLGITRNLVLLNGHRFVPTNINGVVDTNLLPQALVQRVEVVTGGASAAWGSDAVAGVVNYVLNEKFTGTNIDIQGGTSSRGDDDQFKVQAAWGARFADGKGHILFSADYNKIGQVGSPGTRGWYKGYKIVNNPAFVAGNGQPARIIRANVGLSAANANGVITAGPLRGISFGPNGTTSTFNLGTASGLSGYGGDNEDLVYAATLTSKENSRGAFGRVSYDFSNALGIYGEYSYTWTETPDATSRTYERDGNIVIRNDNPFLPASVVSQMTALNLATINVGRFHTDFGPVTGDLKREVKRFVVGAKGEFADNWSWDAYYQYGQTDVSLAYTGVVVPRYNLAIDAVRNPANGQIVCRSTLTDPTNGCQPLNIFGAGSGSGAAQNYVMGVSTQTLRLKQDVAAFTLRGEPLTLPAGPVSIAAGVEYRKERFAAVADALSTTSSFFVGNFKSSAGGYNVKDGFAEIVVPLLKDVPFAQHLDFNGAVRYTDYSYSGRVTTWKVGLTHDVNDQLRFRGTVSRDIRAPNLGELFQFGAGSNAQVTDPVTKTSYNAQTLTSGNLDLKPEVAKTYTGGVVYRPAWLSGLSASVDYYDIKVNGAITTTTPQTTIDRCFAGDTPLCANVIRTGGVISQVKLQPVNIQSLSTSGVDFDFSYSTGLDALFDGAQGDVSVRALGTYVLHRKEAGFGTVVEYAGTNADANFTNQTVTPKWRWLLQATYNLDPVTVNLSGRYISDGVLKREWGPNDISDADNHVPSVFYLDVSVSYKIKIFGERDSSVFFVVDNVFDKAPPISPTVGPSGFLGLGVASIYDTIGREYRAGIRLRF